MMEEVDTVADLQKKLIDTVKQYEERLATFSVFNDALQKENMQLREQIEDNQEPDEEVQDIKLEFARRMATVERDNARLKEKNEQLRAKIGTTSQGGSSIQARLKEREEYISSLQKEGEVLARKNGELEASLRKARASCKETEAEKVRLLSRLKQQDEILDAERDRFERATAQQAQQVAELRRDYEHLQETASEQINSALQESALTAQAAMEEAGKGDQTALQEAHRRESELNHMLETLRLEKEEADVHWSRQVEQLRSEVHTLETRLLSQESQLSEASAHASYEDLSLLRQLEAMAASAKSQEEAHALAQSQLTQRIHHLQAAQDDALQAKQEALAQARRDLEERDKMAASVIELQQQLSSLELALDHEQRQRQELSSQLGEQVRNSEGLQHRLAAEQEAWQAEHSKLKQQLWQSRDKISRLESEREVLIQSNKARQMADRNDAGESMAVTNENERPYHSKMNGNVASSGLEPAKQVKLAADVPSFWAEESFDGAGQSNSSYMGRESDLEDSELLRLQLSSAQTLASRAQEEMFKACKRAEQYQSDALKHQQTLQAMQTLQAQHDLALELLGERNEKVDSLEDDIQEMKHIFHTQLSSLVDEMNALRSA